MWNQPATARQIAALKANGNFDGKYYSKGRAGQTIGESMRSASGSSGSALPASQQRFSSAALGLNELAELIERMRPEPEGPALAAPQLVVGRAVDDKRTGTGSRHPGNHADPAGVLSLDFIAALESRHLEKHRSNHTYGSANGLRQETEAWTKLKLAVAKRIAEGHASVAAALREAPVGVAPMAEDAAIALLTNAVSPDLEERHLWDYLNEHTYGSGDGLRKEILAWLDNRIALASTNANGLIELARTQEMLTPKTSVPQLRSAPPPQAVSPARIDTDPVPSAQVPNTSNPPRGERSGAVSTGKVARINASGAHVALGGGTQGWLHVSKLRVLNGGARVQDVADHLRVGELVQVRDIGTNQRGQILLELVDRGSAATSPDTPRALTTDKPAPASEAVGVTKRFGFFRRRASRTDDQ